MVDHYFVSRVPGQGTAILGSGGLAFIGQSGVTQAISPGFLTFLGGPDRIAKVFAHEVAHNLGLFHSSDPENLLIQGGTPRRLDAAQISQILDSRLTQPV